MATSQLIRENEELRVELQHYRDLVERLEKRVEQLENELEALRKDRDELRRIMKHYKKKYMQLRRIIARAIAISEEMGRELTVNDLRRLLTGELTKRR